MSLDVEVDVLPAAVETVRERGGLVIAQVNDRLPGTYGDAELDVAMVDVMVEADEPLTHGPVAVVDEQSARIGALVVDRVADGATLQAGHGAVPHASRARACGTARASDLDRDVLRLRARPGASWGARPSRPDHCIVPFGSEELLDWVDGNERFRMTRTEVTNDPGRIARNPGMVSVNSARP